MWDREGRKAQVKKGCREGESLRKKNELSSGVVALYCLVSITDLIPSHTHAAVCVFEHRHHVTLTRHTQYRNHSTRSCDSLEQSIREMVVGITCVI